MDGTLAQILKILYEKDVAVNQLQREVNEKDKVIEALKKALMDLSDEVSSLKETINGTGRKQEPAVEHKGKPA